MYSPLFRAFRLARRPTTGVDTAVARFVRHATTAPLPQSESLALSVSAQPQHPVEGVSQHVSPSQNGPSQASNIPSSEPLQPAPPTNESPATWLQTVPIPGETIMSVQPVMVGPAPHPDMLASMDKLASMDAAVGASAVVANPPTAGGFIFSKPMAVIEALLTGVAPKKFKLARKKNV